MIAAAGQQRRPQPGRRREYHPRTGLWRWGEGDHGLDDDEGTARGSGCALGARLSTLSLPLSRVRRRVVGAKESSW